MAKTMDPVVPMLSMFGYRAMILALLEVQVYAACQSTKRNYIGGPGCPTDWERGSQMWALRSVGVFFEELPSPLMET